VRQTLYWFLVVATLGLLGATLGLYSDAGRWQAAGPALFVHSRDAVAPNPAWSLIAEGVSTVELGAEVHLDHDGAKGGRAFAEWRTPPLKPDRSYRVTGEGRAEIDWLQPQRWTWPRIALLSELTPDTFDFTAPNMIVEWAHSSDWRRFSDIVTPNPAAAMLVLRASVARGHAGLWLRNLTVTPVSERPLFRPMSHLLAAGWLALALAVAWVNLAGRRFSGRQLVLLAMSAGFLVLLLLSGPLLAGLTSRLLGEGSGSVTQIGVPLPGAFGRMFPHVVLDFETYGHAGALFLMGVAAAAFLSRSLGRGKALLALGLGAIVLEVVQLFAAGRDVTASDAVVNLLGCWAGFLVARGLGLHDDSPEHRTPRSGPSRRA